MNDQILKIIKDAVRIKPPCNYFPECGGCTLLDISYDTQVEAKKRLIKYTLGGFEPQFVKSPLTLGYRCTARLHYSPGQNKKSAAFGFKKKKSSKIIDIKTCPCLTQSLNSTIKLFWERLLDYLSFPVEVGFTGTIDKAVSCVKSDQPLDEKFYIEARKIINETYAGVGASIYGINTVVSGSCNLAATGIDGMPFYFSGFSFVQANNEINRQLSLTVKKWVSDISPKSICELFSGNGNLTIILASIAKKTACAELNKDAYCLAKKNIETRNLKGVTFYNTDAVKVFEKYGAKSQMVVLDPPRTGSFDLMKKIINGNNRFVLYISCNPLTLFSDCRILLQANYKIIKATGFDMFAGTSHVEMAVLFER